MSTLYPLLARARLYADRAEWLAARPGQDRTNIGASEVANIRGVGFLTPFEFWAARQAGEPDTDMDIDLTPDDGDGEPPPTSPLSRGNRWEPVVLDEYAAITGIEVQAAGAAFGQPGALVTVTDAEIPWLTASPDAFGYPVRAPHKGIECKTSVVSGRLWGPNGTAIRRADDFDPTICPPGYYLQCQQQTRVLDLETVDLAVLLGSYRLRVFTIVRDEAYHRELIDDVGEWRERHLVRGEAPPIDGSDGAKAWLRARFAAVKGSERAATDEEANLIRLFAEVKTERKACEIEEDALRNRIANAMGSHVTLYIKGEPRGVSLSAGKVRRMSLYGF